MITSDCLAERRPLADISQMRVTFYLLEHSFKVGVSIRITISKIDLIFIILKLIVPTQCKIWLILSTTLTVSILIIFNILSISMPTYIPFLTLSLWVYDDLHTHSIKIIHLIVIENVESTSMTLESIWYFEEKPLTVAICVDIVLEKEVIFIVTNLRCHRQVATLKARLKDKSPIIFIFQGIKCSYLFVITIIFSWSPTSHFVQITCPNIPIFINVVNFFITFLFVFSVHHFVKCISYPAKVVVLVN